MRHTINTQKPHDIVRLLGNYPLLMMILETCRLVWLMPAATRGSSLTCFRLASIMSLPLSTQEPASQMEVCFHHSQRLYLAWV